MKGSVLNIEFPDSIFDNIKNLLDVHTWEKIFQTELKSFGFILYYTGIILFSILRDKN